MSAVDGSMRTPCAIAAADVVQLLERARVPMEAEAPAQAEVERILVSAYGAGAVRREFRLQPRDRPDFFLAGGIVVELKGPRHRQPDVLRQLLRYAEDERVRDIVLCTARAMGMPAALGAREVPCWPVNFGRAWF